MPHMGFIKNAKMNQMSAEATKAAQEGRLVFTPKLNTPATQHGMSGDIPDWSLMIQAIEETGWVMYHWSVAMDSKGRPEAYPLFRRAA